MHSTMARIMKELSDPKTFDRMSNPGRMEELENYFAGIILHAFKHNGCMELQTDYGNEYLRFYNNSYQMNMEIRLEGKTLKVMRPAQYTCSYPSNIKNKDFYAIVKRLLPEMFGTTLKQSIAKQEQENNGEE